MIFFIHLPRTGGTFISQYARHRKTRLSKEFNYYGTSHAEKKHQPASSVPNREDYFLFGLIRNPFDWYVSRYHYFIDKTSKGIYLPEDEISKNSDAGLVGEEFQNKFTFKEHIKYGLTSTPNFWLNNLHDYMFCDKGKIIMNYIGKFEKMSEELDYVLKLNGTEARIPLKDYWGNKNASKRGDYHEYYDNELINIITEKDKKILNLYGYTY
jgi:hypothetical protein